MLRWSHVVAALLALAVVGSAMAGEAKPRYEWKHDEGKSLTFLVDGRILWTLRYDKTLPLCTRVLIHPGLGDNARLAKEWQDYGSIEY